MRKRTLQQFALISMATLLLAGCGSDTRSASGDSYVYSGVESATYESTDKYMDYTGVTITGDLADYSYEFNGSGDVKDKETVLSAYDKVQAYVNETGGYISDFNNNYTGYYIDPTDTSFSKTEILHLGSGSLKFTVEVKNEYAKDVIQILDDFINENHMYVTKYTEKATNYKSYTVVDSYNDSYTNYTSITAEELERRLAYSTITVRLFYAIPRDGMESFGLRVKNFFGEFKDIIQAIILCIVIVLVFLWAIVFLGAVPIYKCVRKAVMKHKKKKPELYPAKEIKVLSEEKKDETTAN